MASSTFGPHISDLRAVLFYHLVQQSQAIYNDIYIAGLAAPRSQADNVLTRLYKAQMWVSVVNDGIANGLFDDCTSAADLKDTLDAISERALAWHSSGTCPQPTPEAERMRMRLLADLESFGFAIGMSLSAHQANVLKALFGSIEQDVDEKDLSDPDVVQTIDAKFRILCRYITGVNLLNEVPESERRRQSEQDNINTAGH